MSFDDGVTSGFLIVKTFERMCREYPANFESYRQYFPEITHGPILPEQMPGKYRGLAREPIQKWHESCRGYWLFEGLEPSDHELAACIFMAELCETGRAKGCFIFSEDDARKLYELIQPPVEREIVWARRVDKTDSPPHGAMVLGYEPISGDFSSTITHFAFFRYSRKSIENSPYRNRAKVHLQRLNKWGLFETPARAHEYRDSFPSLQEPVYPDHIVEVRTVT